VTESRTFAVVLEPEEEGGFTVRVPAFPEIVTCGKDEREALAMAEDAVRLVVADCQARGESIPGGEPRSGDRSNPSLNPPSRPRT
jgi:antitoxin HicB